MRALVEKIHIYIGLLNFANLIVFGIAGLAATFQGGPERKMISEPLRYERFVPPAGSTDKQIADQVLAYFRFPFAEPAPGWAIHRDAAGNLPLEFWTVNGIHKVLYEPRQNRLRVETIRSRLPFFLDDMHTVTSVQQPDWRLRLWAVYNHFAIWSLLWMTMSGIYLWLASRPRYRVAQYSFAGGTAIFILMYALTR